VAVAQYTHTHKQYTEQHIETEYPEPNTHNNKNTSIHKIKQKRTKQYILIYSDTK